MIEEIELQIRRIIDSVYGGNVSSALQEMSGDAEQLRTVDRLNDCSFSHYVQFVSIHWEDGFDEFFSEQYIHPRTDNEH